MKSVNLFFYTTAIGIVGIADNGEAITDLFFCENNCNKSDGAVLDKEALRKYELMSSIGMISSPVAMKESSGRNIFQETARQIAGKVPEKNVIIKETDLIQEASSQLKEYLHGERRSFRLPLSPTGTSFQMAVWNALMEIPYGETRSYGDIAMAIGRPKACRAVGMACNRNKIAIFIPCHRVIGADGKLVGFGGGIEIKRKLLSNEGLDIGGYCIKPGDSK